MRRYLIAILLILLFPLLSFAANTSIQAPTANTAGTGGWASPTNAYTSDDVWANETTNNHSHLYYNYSSTSLDALIPDGSTIDGVLVEIEGYIDVILLLNGDLVTIEVELSIDGGTVWSTAKTGNFLYDIPGIDLPLVQYGGATDKWGLTLVDGSFTDANFRARYKVTNLAAGNETIYIDAVRVTVYYTVGGVRMLAISGVGK